MLPAKNSKNKNAAYMIMIAIVGLAAAGLYFGFVKIKDNKAVAGSAGLSAVSVKKLQVKKIDLSIFSVDNFTKLEDYSPYFQKKESVPGNQNPFLSIQE